MDIGGQHGRRFVLLRHTRRPQKRPFVQTGAETSDTGAGAVKTRSYVVLGRAIPEGWVGDESLEALSKLPAFHR